MGTAKKVMMNTSFLYGKMVIKTIIALYSTRLIIKGLGVDDFGLFNLIAGVIAMLSFLNSAMSISTQRFLSFHIGAGDKQKLQSIFMSSVVLHLIIGVVLVVLFELAGIVLFDGMLKIPGERLHAAKTIYQFMIISTFFTINAVPYNATINSHENMLLDSLVGIFESLAKLGIAFWLLSASTDRLILYGLLIAFLTILIRIILSVYCNRHYDESRIRFPLTPNWLLIKEMIAFAGWNLYGSFCVIFRGQGMAVILNTYFGVIINASYGIANQVNGTIRTFSSNLLKAINPQIVKSEGGGDRERMLRLSMLACKMSFILLSFFAVPVIIEAQYILDVWLDSVPEYSIVFCQLMLLRNLVGQLTYGLVTAIQSVGKIRNYQLVVGTIILMNLPLGYGLLYLGFSAPFVIFSSIILEIIVAVFRIYFSKKLTGLDISLFVTKTVFPALIAVLISAGFAFLISNVMEKGFLRLTLVVLTNFIFIIVLGRYIALTAEENSNINKLILKFVKRTHSI